MRGVKIAFPPTRVCATCGRVSVVVAVLADRLILGCGHDHRGYRAGLARWRAR